MKKLPSIIAVKSYVNRKSCFDQLATASSSTPPWNGVGLESQVTQITVFTETLAQRQHLTSIHVVEWIVRNLSVEMAVFDYSEMIQKLGFLKACNGVGKFGIRITFSTDPWKQTSLPSLYLTAFNSESMIFKYTCCRGSTLWMFVQLFSRSLYYRVDWVDWDLYSLI